MCHYKFVVVWSEKSVSSRTDELKKSSWTRSRDICESLSARKGLHLCFCPLFGRKKQGDSTFILFIIPFWNSRILEFSALVSFQVNSTFCSRSWCQTSWLQCPRCRCRTPSTCSWTLPSPWRCSQRSGRWSESCIGCPASGEPPACIRNWCENF